MERHVLSLHLQSLDDEALEQLHVQLVTICTGKQPAEVPEISREIRIEETTDCRRGELLRRLLGDNVPLDGSWIPDGTRLLLHSAICFRSDPEAAIPRFHVEFPGLPSREIESATARERLQEARSHGPARLSIQANLPGLPAGWSFHLEPPRSPREMTPDDADLFRAALRVIACRNCAAAQQILEYLGSAPHLPQPILMVVDEIEKGDPSTIDGVRIAGVVEAAVLLRGYCERTELFVKPDRQRRIRAILAIHGHALQITQQAQTASVKRRHLDHTLEGARNSWRKLFLVESREAIRDLQLRVISHPMQKTQLITNNAREAQVANYARNLLLPLIRNFLDDCLLELKKVDISFPSTLPQTSAGKPGNSDSYLLAGTLFALPSLGLLLPSMSIPPSDFTTLAPNTEPATSPPPEAATLPDHGWEILGRLKDKVEKVFDAGKDLIGDTLSAPLKGVENKLSDINESFGALNQNLGKLIGMVVMGQAAVAIAAVIGAVIVVKGSMSLTQTEQLLLDLLDKTNACWPEIEGTLQRLLPAMEGTVDEEVRDRAMKVIAVINQS